MTLVERFIEINDWTSNRKMVLLAGLSLPATVLNWWITHTALAGSSIADASLFDRIYIGGILIIAVSFAISLASERLGHAGRWIPYAFVLMYGSFLGTLLYAMGTWSTIWFSIVPLTVLLAALYFGERLGWFTFICSLLVIGAFGWLQAAGVLPYAPALLDRSIDVQQSAIWILCTVMPVLWGYLFAFGLCMLSVGARRVQEARLQAAQELIRRYVPSQLAEKIVTGGHGASTKTERRNLTIFFSDVEGFTNASDELDPEQLAALLNEYLSEMATIADRHGATINQFVGDGIMIFFGAPTATSDEDHALRAVRMSLEMQRRMTELQQIWFKRGFQRPFRIRIGINTGYASVGDFGSQGRVVYSAIGLQTNLAARIQSHCEPGKVLISHSTWALVHEEISCEPKDELQVKGIHYPVKVYEVSDS